ncbi:MAG TPA: quinolinate synthase NadA [Candidatus Methylomirabilis sp.]|nr:quinolinate synthase NadA [Candidatus Methylomirabilis sp.]
MPVAADISQEIRRLRAERKAVILAHNYQVPEVQDIADFTGDSLGLARAAARTDADVIVFCGVHFMAETASILCPDKTVLLPDLEAGCSLAATITAEELRRWKAEHPGAVVVSYVNTTAEVKAESDYCCTSANAVKVVQAIPPDREILFLPDLYLGDYVARVTGRKNIHVWPGECHVHAGIRPAHFEEALRLHPDAGEIFIHPECGCTTNCIAFAQDTPELQDRIHILSTSGMIRRSAASAAQKFIVATETGILYPLQKGSPNKTFIPLKADAVCEYMKRITLEKVLRSLQELVFQVKVSESVAARARTAIERMLEFA